MHKELKKYFSENSYKSLQTKQKVMRPTSFRCHSSKQKIYWTFMDASRLRKSEFQNYFNHWEHCGKISIMKLSKDPLLQEELVAESDRC